MYARIFKPVQDQSFFLFGPRGTGKSSWVKCHYPSAAYVDLLNDNTFRRLLARPESLSDFFSSDENTVVIDEVQKVPALLDEVHRLIEKRKIKFVLTGSSARKLKRLGVINPAGSSLTFC